MTTDTTDLKMTEDAHAEETAAFKDTTQDFLAIQAKVADYEATNNSLSEELEAFAKAKAVISEKTDDAGYRDNQSVLSSRGCVARKFTKSEHSIELVQLASHVVFAMHAETSDDDDLFREGQRFDQWHDSEVGREGVRRCFSQGHGRLWPTEFSQR